jgi:hypothetical protein
MAKSPNYTLLDGEAHNRRYPRTFHIPSILEKMMVEKGDYVKLSFSCPGYDNSERMWVLVTGYNKGILNNDPAFLPLYDGMPVKFQRQHIIGILKKDEL